MGARWGIATIENGVIVGVSGRYRLARQARRRLAELETQIDLSGLPTRRYKLVRRSGTESVDWGARPTSVS